MRRSPILRRFNTCPRWVSSCCRGRVRSRQSDWYRFAGCPRPTVDDDSSTGRVGQGAYCGGSGRRREGSAGVRNANPRHCDDPGRATWAIARRGVEVDLHRHTGILLRVNVEGRIPQIEPLLMHLDQLGFRLSAKTHAAVLRQTVNDSYRATVLGRPQNSMDHGRVTYYPPAIPLGGRLRGRRTISAHQPPYLKSNRIACPTSKSFAR